MKTSQKNTPPPKQRPTRAITSFAPIATRDPTKRAITNPISTHSPHSSKIIPTARTGQTPTSNSPNFGNATKNTTSLHAHIATPLKKASPNLKNPASFTNSQKITATSTLMTSPSTLRANSSANFPRTPLPWKPASTSALSTYPTEATTNRPLQNFGPCSKSRPSNTKKPTSNSPSQKIILKWPTMKTHSENFCSCATTRTRTPSGSYPHK